MNHLNNDYKTYVGLGGGGGGFCAGSFSFSVGAEIWQENGYDIEVHPSISDPLVSRTNTRTVSDSPVLMALGYLAASYHHT